MCGYGKGKGNAKFYCTVLYCTVLLYFEAARLACTIVPIVLCNTVYYAVLLMMND